MSHAHAASASSVYGLIAEFDTPDQLLQAARSVHAAGYTKADAFSPYPIHGLAEAFGFKDRRISTFTFLGGLTGVLAGYGLEYFTQVLSYPMNIGGRPYHSWVSFIPPAYETMILFGAFTAGISMIVLNGLPRPYHPVFNAKRFHLASQDKFFLVVEADDPKFKLEETGAFLFGLNAREVVPVDE